MVREEEWGGGSGRGRAWSDRRRPTSGHRIGNRIDQLMQSNQSTEYLQSNRSTDRSPAHADITDQATRWPRRAPVRAHACLCAACLCANCGGSYGDNYGGDCEDNYCGDCGDNYGGDCWDNYDGGCGDNYGGGCGGNYGGGCGGNYGGGCGDNYGGGGQSCMPSRHTCCYDRPAVVAPQTRSPRGHSGPVNLIAHNGHVIAQRTKAPCRHNRQTSAGVPVQRALA